MIWLQRDRRVWTRARGGRGAPVGGRGYRTCGSRARRESPRCRRATDADVLQIDVHVSRTREQQIVAASEERIARARLNQLMGARLGEAFLLDIAPVVSTSIDAIDLAALEAEAIKARPEVTVAAPRNSWPVRARRRPAPRYSRTRTKRNERFDQGVAAEPIEVAS
jgi:hypothetical protein